MSTSTNMETSASYETAGVRFNLNLTAPEVLDQAQRESLFASVAVPLEVPYPDGALVYRFRA